MTISKERIKNAAEALYYSTATGGIKWEELDNENKKYYQRHTERIIKADDSYLAKENARLREEIKAWQPIQTAPKDGTEILVYADNRPKGKEVSVAFWVENKKKKGFAFLEHPLMTLFIDDNLTHWMPLPKPTAIKQKDEV